MVTFAKILYHTAATAIYPLSLHDALPILRISLRNASSAVRISLPLALIASSPLARSEEHTSELQSRPHLVCRLLLEKKKFHGSPALVRILDPHEHVAAMMAGVGPVGPGGA